MSPKPASRRSNPLTSLQAWVEAERAIEHARSGDHLDERWGFLPALRFAEMDDLRQRARAYVESETFSPEVWSSFIDGEAERAWAAYDPVILPPDPPEPLPAVPAADSALAALDVHPAMPHQADPS